MKTISRSAITTLGLAVLAAALTPSVFAGCGEMPAKPAASIGGKLQSYLVRAAYRPAQFVLVDDSPAGSQIVGLWHVIFTQDSDFGSGLFDDSYAQWHSDGTEIMNSGTHSPANGNFCMGVWAKTGGSTYVLKHVALDYSVTHGTTPDVIVIIREQVTLDQNGNHFTGTFTADLYAPYSSAFPATPGNHIVRVGEGTISGDRITAD